jgi:hypothetical protein
MIHRGPQHISTAGATQLQERSSDSGFKPRIVRLVVAISEGRTSIPSRSDGEYTFSHE